MRSGASLLDSLPEKSYTGDKRESSMDYGALQRTDNQFELLEQFQYFIDRAKYYGEAPDLETLEFLQKLYVEVLDSID